MGTRSQSITHSCTGSANLAVVKSGPDGIDPLVLAGDTNGYDYTLTVSTVGPSDAGFTIADTLATGLTFQTLGSDPACTADGQDVTCGGTIVGNGAAQDFTIHVLVDPSVEESILQGSVTVSVAPDGTEDPAPFLNNTTDNVDTAITTQADLTSFRRCHRRRQRRWGHGGCRFRVHRPQCGTIEQRGRVLHLGHAARPALPSSPREAALSARRLVRTSRARTTAISLSVPRIGPSPCTRRSRPR